MMNDIISSFNAGELSPLLESRTSLDKYRAGCKKLENFLITPYGPINRRSGTEYVGSAKIAGKRCRLFGLNLSDTTKLVMEVGEGYVRFWKSDPSSAAASQYTYPSTLSFNGITYAAGSPVEAIAITDASTATAPVYKDAMGVAPGAAHPYREQDLRDLKICQINNVIYVTHPLYPVMRISNWGFANPYNPPMTIGPVNWAWAPMLDENFTSTTLTPSDTTGTITLASSDPIFTLPSAGSNGHVGSFWQLSHANSRAMISRTLNTNTDASAGAAPLQVLGDWELQTYGNWSGTVTLDTSVDNVTWTTIRNYYSGGDSANYVSSGSTQKVMWFRVTLTGAAGGTAAGNRLIFQPVSPILSGYVKITSITDTKTATAIVQQPLYGSTATTQWREGAFSDVQGYPNACSIHESRVIYAGTLNNPAEIWGSRVSDFENFKQGAYAADSYSFSLASTTGGRINWMVSKNALLIGTTQDEWYLSGTSIGTPIAPGNVIAQKESHYGSANLPAHIVNDTILYIQRMARKIREFIYTWQSETWVSNDLTALANHVTSATVVEMAYQRVPDAIMWMVRGDGQLVAMTYEREQQVTGFSRQITDGIFESVATINGVNNEDEVWVAVKRTVNGSTVRYIERFRPGMRDALDNADKGKWWYLDAAKTMTATSSLGISSQSGCTYSRSGYAVNVTTPAPHGLQVGDTVRFSEDSRGAFSGLATVATVNDASTAFTFTSAIASGFGTGTLTWTFAKAIWNGLAHLEGLAVSVWADAASVPLLATQPSVSGGTITLQEPVSKILVGLPFTSTLIPEQLQRDLQDGTSAGRRMRVTKINLKLYNSTAGEYSSDQITWFPLPARNATDLMDNSPPTIFGFERLSMSSNWRDGSDICLRQSLPMPLTVAAIVASWESSESGQ